MTTITIHASTTYSVLIGTGLLEQTGTLLCQNCSGLSEKKLVLVTDSNVAPLYGALVSSSLRELGCQVLLYKIPAGESSKNWSLLGSFLEFLANAKLTRTDMLIALGGGVVGDFTGFAASIYQRGIPFVQIPTTLLAAVDSSVGGKTAVDLHAGKNLAGTFWQPSFVLCDVDTFSTLSKDAWLDGIAETIKYGILQDFPLFQEIENGTLKANCEAIIARCLTMKGALVSKDEFDHGTRELLNLGHTFGHAIELLSDYHTSHGQAVAIGIHLAGKTALKLNLCNSECSNQISTTLLALGFSLHCSYSKDAMVKAMLADKKRRGTMIDLILPYSIGDCRIYPVSVNKLLSIFPDDTAI